MNRSHMRGVLLARPQANQPAEELPPGSYRLDLPTRRADNVLYIPATCRRDRPAPLLLLLHGAGGYGEGMLSIFRRQADRTGTPVLAPTAEGVSWDIISGGYGQDVRNIDAALRQAFTRIAVDPERLAVGGFSDGASYALSLGVTNGGLFTHVLAFSPGFLLPSRHEKSPHLFIAHGTDDRILPIYRSSRRLVPRLQMQGYDLSYHEFQGGHEIPPDLLELAFRWFLS